MNKKSFIPKAYRPSVPGSRLQDPPLNFIEVGFLPEISTYSYPLLISAKEDIVPDYFLKEIDSKSSIKHIYYDDLGIEWDFSFSNGILKIHLQDGVIIPTVIYHRHPGVNKNHLYYDKHIAFFEVIDVWQGNLMGQKRDHYHNFSKAYQGITSIRSATQKNGEQIARYPRSFFLKGDFKLLQEQFKGSLVVKSCSNIRSKVVSEEIFSHWEIKNLYYLPTLFQEKIKGKDIRVHICGKNIWALRIEAKDCIDYRYASKGSIKYKLIQLPHFVRLFCESIAEYENNRLTGIDLMKSGNTYFCLESNPGPGWSTFNHSSKTQFANHILNELLRR